MRLALRPVAQPDAGQVGERRHGLQEDVAHRSCARGARAISLHELVGGRLAGVILRLAHAGTAPSTPRTSSAERRVRSTDLGMQRAHGSPSSAKRAICHIAPLPPASMAGIRARNGVRPRSSCDGSSSAADPRSPARSAGRPRDRSRSCRPSRPYRIARHMFSSISRPGCAGERIAGVVVAAERRRCTPTRAPPTARASRHLGLPVADAHLERPVAVMGPDAPPDLGALVDRAGALQQRDERRVLVPVARTHRGRRSAGSSW